VPPDGRNSRRYDWRDAPALGPRASELAPFLGEFFEPPKEATEWESAPSGYLKSCRSRFSSVSSGGLTLLSPLSPPPALRRECAIRATWAGTSSRPSLLPPSFPPTPSRTAPRPSHASRPATGALFRVPRRAYNRESSPPLPLRLPYSSARIGPYSFLSIIVLLQRHVDPARVAGQQNV
jgi:hypothetical protein